MLHSILFCFSTLFSWVLAIAPGELNIKLDPEFEAQKKFVFKSYVVFNDNVQTDWTPEEFVGLFQQAHADILTGMLSYAAEKGLSQSGREKRSPYAMSAIAIGNTVSFSSSCKGRGKAFFYDPIGTGEVNIARPAVLSAKAKQCVAIAQALRKCSSTAPGSDEHFIHRTSANCGEEWAAYQYCLEHPDADFTGARVVTWENPKSIVGGGNVMAPCVGNDQNFGCSLLLRELAMDVIPNETKPDNTRNAGIVSCTTPSFCSPPDSS